MKLKITVLYRIFLLKHFQPNIYANAFIILTNFKCSLANFRLFILFFILFLNKICKNLKNIIYTII
jgi:hypothetical protein